MKLKFNFSSFISFFLFLNITANTAQSFTDREKWIFFDEIVNERSKTALFHLTANMRIGITGNPTPEDSAAVIAVVAELDSLIQTLKFEIVKENSNVDICFDAAFENKQPEFIKTLFRGWWPFTFLKMTPRITVSIFTKSTTQSERDCLVRDIFANLLIGRIYNSSTYPRHLSISAGLDLPEPGRAEIEHFVLQKMYSKKLGDQLKRFWGLPLLLVIGKSHEYDLAISGIWAALLFIFWVVFWKFKLDYYFGSKIPSRWLRGNILIFLGVQLFVLVNYLYNSDLIQQPFYPVYLKYLEFYAISFGILLFNLLYLVDQYILARLRFKWLGKIIDLILTYLGLIFVSLLITIFIVSPVGTRFVIPLPLGLALGIILFRLFRNSKFLKIRNILRDKDLELAKIKEALTKAELNALHSRINPHFLYNALNSIAGIAHENADKTEQMALSLARLFRYNINQPNAVFSSLEQEMEMVRIYLDIEKVRFGNRLTFAIHLPEALKKVQIPRFLIQPLVENAVKHGISRITENGFVKITAEADDGWLKLAVYDNGPDFPADLFGGYGIQSVYDKLNLLYPEQYQVQFVNGTEKSLRIDLKMEPKIQ